MLKAARRLAANPRRPAPFQFVLPLAATLTAAQREAVRRLAAQKAPNLALHFVSDARTALFHARASVVASGTATVEAALIGNPFVVVYRVSPLTYLIAKRVVKVPHVAMVNLIAGRRLVPELIQDDFTAGNIVQQIELLLPDGPARQSMTQGLEDMRRILAAGGGSQVAIRRVASVTLELMGAASPRGGATALPS